MNDKAPEAFRTISEVASILDTPPHVLRFWETKFTQLKPVKRAGGRRYYRPSDVLLLGGIKRLLHEDGMTIRGVQKLLRTQGVRHVAGLAPTKALQAIGADEARAVEAAEAAPAGTAGAGAAGRRVVPAPPAPDEDPEQPDLFSGAAAAPLPERVAPDADAAPEPVGAEVLEDGRRPATLLRTLATPPSPEVAGALRGLGARIAALHARMSEAGGGPA
jgi:DNA-binding transcriptional MerR regulator